MSEQFLTAHQHIRYLVPYHGVVDLHKKGYNQGYLATIKINNKYIVKSEREK